MTWSRWRSTRCWSTAPGSRRSTPLSPGRNPDVMHQPPLDPRTPVIAGVGQASERLGAYDYRQRSPVELAADAAREALADTGARPARAVLEVSGGQAPQHLVNEFAAVIAAGGSEATLIFGSEAISTIEHYARAEPRPDFTEHVDGSLEDRGYGLAGMMSPHQ